MPTHDVVFALLLSKALGPVSFRFVTNFASWHFKSEVQEYRYRVVSCESPGEVQERGATVLSCFSPEKPSTRLLYS
jgi:hypothetical protein